MSTIERFEEIRAWQDARQLVSMIYEACKSSPLGKDFGMRDQIQRAGVSIMANIAEGFGRRGKREFLQYLRMARGSCSEVQSHLYVAHDVGLIDEENFKHLNKQAELVGRQISAFTTYLNRQLKASK